MRAASAAGRRCGSEALCEAAASLLLRVRKWSALRAWEPADRQEIEHAVRDRRGRAQACRYPAQVVGQRNRLPRRLRRQDHATIAIEACTLHGSQGIRAGVASSMLKRSKD